MLFISIHYLLFITVRCCFLAFHLFPFFFVFVFAWVSIASLKPILFLSVPSHCPHSLSSTLGRAASQSKAQKKLQPLTQVPILQEQGEYCAGVGGVWTWVPTVPSTGVVLLFLFFVLFLSRLRFSLSPFISPLQGCLECWHHSHPCLRDAPHDAGDVGHLCGVSVCVCGLQRRVQLCMWAPGCINISYPTLMLLLLEVMINSSVTSPQQESH